MTVKERLVEFIAYKGPSQRRFELAVTAGNVEGFVDNEIGQAFERLYVPGFEGLENY